MSAPTSPLFAVQLIGNAGRGVIARQRIPEGAVVLESGPPAVHVVFKQYGKETCAHCFRWDRGRALPVREHELGKVFCSSACRQQWVDEAGAVGADAWRAVTAFGRQKSGKAEQRTGEGAKPTREGVDHAWQEATNEALLLRKARPDLSKQERKRLQTIQRTLPLAKDPDLLSFLLSGVLHDYSAADGQRQELLDLATDDVPYNTQRDLDDSCRAFLQLTSILPAELLPHVTPQVCLHVVASSNLNAFGIRGGGEDAEEYMGYGVYPAASYFNHSCHANMHKKRVGRSWQFRAARAIEPGEECCITYLGGDEKHLDLGARRGRLSDVWGFVCQCVRCKTEAKAVGRHLVGASTDDES